jgi:DNA-binding beta-propeller fold protein YncE
VGHTGDIWVTVIDAAVRLHHLTGHEVARVPVGLLPAAITLNPVTDDLWIALSGGDVIQVIDGVTHALLKTRNTGTFPVGISCGNNDLYGSVAVTVLYGNQLKLYSRVYSDLMDLGTIAFPNACLHLDDGRVLVAQQEYDMVLVAEGR